MRNIELKPGLMSSSVVGSLRSLNGRDAMCRLAPSRARVRTGAPRRRPAPKAPTALRCSGRGRAARLASFAALTALEQLRRVGSRSARVRAPTETLRSSPPHRRASAHPPAAWRGGSTCCLLEQLKRRASGPAPARTRACGARQAAGSMPWACRTPLPENVRSRKAWGRPVPGCACGGQQRSPGVGARSRALREPTRCSCSSAVHAANDASSAARPQGEYRSAPRAAGRRSRSPAPAGPMPCSRTDDAQTYGPTFATAHDGPTAHARLMRRESHQVRRSH
jgi:hypothetical protein